MKTGKMLVYAIVICALLSVGTYGQAQATGWLDPAWSYRNPVTVSNPNSSLLSNFQVRILLDSSFNFANAKSDGSDLRLTDSDGVTPIPFWVESWNASQGSAII